MDQSRSNSVPLIHIDGLNDDDNDTDRKLQRSSFSMSSIQPMVSRPTSPQLPMIWHSATQQVPLNDTDDDDTVYQDDYMYSDEDSSLSESDDETSIAIPGRKTMAASHIHQYSIPVLDLSSDILYEDIWIDSPVFNEYLQSLETWLYYYLTWLEKVEQCRQLEIGKCYENKLASNMYLFCTIAYTKSITLLCDQTKLMLNEPFFTSEECNNLNWPNDTKSMDVDEILDNEDIRSILRMYL